MGCQAQLAWNAYSCPLLWWAILTRKVGQTGLVFGTRSGYISRSVYAGCRITDQQVWFPVDFQETFSWKFSRISSFIGIYRAGSLTPEITLILFTQAITQLKDIYRGLIAPISINPGLLQDVFTDTLWSTRILSQPENFQETLLISSRFPGGKIIPVDSQDSQEY